MLNGKREAPEKVLQFIREKRLPDEYVDYALQVAIPLAQKISERSRASKGALFVGVNGGQGTGKSTLSELVALILRDDMDLSVAVVSLDDLYLSKAQRQILGENVHPLLETRGVPGSHEVPLALELFEAVSLGRGVDFPVFHKAVDDRAESEVTEVPAGVDVFLFEGWCVGAVAESSVMESQSAFETEADPEAIWRTYVNDQLRGDYQALFGYLDMLVMLKAPSFGAIFRWRAQQEKQLADRVARSGGDASGVMSEEELVYFISHYERLTRHMLLEMPDRADVLIELAEDHTVVRTRGI